MTATIAQEEDVKMDAIARELEQQVKKIRHKAKAARRASVKLLKRSVAPRKVVVRMKKMRNVALLRYMLPFDVRASNWKKHPRLKPCQMRPVPSWRSKSMIYLWRSRVSLVKNPTQSR